MVCGTSVSLTNEPPVDVHSNIFARRADDPPFLVNLQSDHLSELRTVVVAPLWPATTGGPSRSIHAAIRFERRDYWLAVVEIAFVRISSLGPIMGSVATERDRIVRALDLLFTGV